MSDDSNDKEPEKLSSIPPLEIPEFKSKIPPHLLAQASEESKYILNELSEQSARLFFIVPTLASTYEEVRRTNGRVKRLESFRNMITSWYALLFGCFSIIGGIAGIFEICKVIFFSHKP